MQIGRISRWSLVVAMLAAAASCRGGSYDEDSYRSARQQRSALALARYIQDDLRGDYKKDEARALLDEHFEFALSRVVEGDSGALPRALLSTARAAGEPRIGVRVGVPEVAAELLGGARDYFDDNHGWDYYFADGASKAASAAFPHEVLVFSSPASYGFEKAKPGIWVDVEWSVFPSGAVFSGPASIGNIGQEPPPIQGIGIEARLILRLDGSEVPIEVTAKGQAREGFTYSSSFGFASEDEVYAGMVTAAFEDVVHQILQ